jgi:hypothetical protein
MKIIDNTKKLAEYTIISGIKGYIWFENVRTIHSV